MASFLSVLKIVRNIRFLLQYAGAYVACHGLPALSLSLSLGLESRNFGKAFLVAAWPELKLIEHNAHTSPKPTKPKC